MDIQKFNSVPITAKTVLVAPLDWGLGHVTRCIPVIRALLKRENRVIIAATGARKALLGAEFPGIQILDLPDYAVRLPAAGRLTLPGLLWQLPRLWLVRRKENRWLKNLCRAQPVDVIISDNRYGLYNKGVPSVFITHQLFICSGLGLRFDRWLMRAHYRLISRFGECWVPDNADPELSLAGRLSHPPVPPPFPVTYLGLLSRFAGTATGNARAVQPGSLLILLSGPEPQRSVAEGIIRKQLVHFSGHAVLVRGLPASQDKTESGERKAGTAPELPPEESNLEVFDHLPAAALRGAMETAGTIICRSGYSTLMDLMALQKTALLVPAPGQTEQEYLARYMTDRGWMTSQRQQAFALGQALPLAPAASGGNAGECTLPKLPFFDGDLPPLTLRRI